MKEKKQPPPGRDRRDSKPPAEAKAAAREAYERMKAGAPVEDLDFDDVTEIIELATSEFEAQRRRDMQQLRQRIRAITPLPFRADPPPTPAPVED